MDHLAEAQIEMAETFQKWIGEFLRVRGVLQKTNKKTNKPTKTE